MNGNRKCALFDFCLKNVSNCGGFPQSISIILLILIILYATIGAVDMGKYGKRYEI